MAGAWEATGATGARPGDFPGGSLGAQAPSLARGVPMSSLDPRRTPASPDKRPSAFMGLRHMGPATALRQVERAWAAATDSHGPILPWGLRPAPLLGG